ncbi:MAG: deoxyribonuclease IV [Candidatus Krumholzibacteriota bacterium]|nr:deoxyribonuclease IV [Candidatus Krumholzibacteriota bacterium]
MSTAGGVHLALERGRSIGCNAVQLFVKSNTQWSARPLEDGEIAAFRALRRTFRAGHVIAHTSYLINIASPVSALLEKSRESLALEIERCAALGIPSLVLHPGSHRGEGLGEGIERAAESLNAVFAATPKAKVAVLLENTAGAGHTIGSRFADIAAIIRGVRRKSRVGVLYDTCHGFAAGYDIRTTRAYDRTFAEFDALIGLDWLKAFHLNDSLRGLGEHLDRHVHIGAGEIGLAGFRRLVNDPRFFDRPMILETPKGEDMAEDVENLARLRGLRRGEARHMNPPG